MSASPAYRPTCWYADGPKTAEAVNALVSGRVWCPRVRWVCSMLSVVSRPKPTGTPLANTG